MLRKIALLVSAIAVFAFPSFASAEQNYIVGKLGVYSPESSDLTDFGFSSDFAGGVAVGHYFNPNFAVEAGVGHLQTSATEFDAAGNIFVNEDIDATFIEATAKLVFPIPYFYYATRYRPAMDLYVGAGGGVYFANDDIDAIGFHQSDTVGGFHVLGGADFNIDRHFFLGFELKYLWAKPFATRIDGLIFSGNFGYRF